AEHREAPQTGLTRIGLWGTANPPSTAGLSRSAVRPVNGPTQLQALGTHRGRRVAGFQPRLRGFPRSGVGPPFTASNPALSHMPARAAGRPAVHGGGLAGRAACRAGAP